MANTASSAAEGTVPLIELSPRKRNAVLFAVLLGLFLSALDQTVVGTALPRIVTDLHGSGLYTWVVTAYLVSSTITVPIYGKLSDVYGRRPLLLIGITIFLAGSLLAGLSQNMTQLILFRALQGLGAGALFPISLAIIGDLFTPRERGRYQGLFGAVFGLSFIVGPFTGGWLTDNVSWHWVFYVNMPIGFAALAVIATVLPTFHPNTGTTARDLDYLGIAVFTASIIPILLGLTNKGLTNAQGQLNGWTDPGVGGLMILGATLLVAFLFIESRAKQPIIPLDLFRNRTYSATNLAVFLVAFGMFAAVIFLPRYYQAVKGISATESGYLIWPLLVGLIGSSITTGIVITRTGKYKKIMLGAMTSLIVGAYLMTHLQTNTPNALAWFWMFLIGVGIGPSMSGFTVVVQNVASGRQLGAATSTLTFLRQIGGAVGLAISGTLFSQTFAQKLPGQFAASNVPLAVARRFSGGAGASSQGSLTGVGLANHLQHTLPPHLQSLVPNIVSAIHNAFSLSIGDVFWLTAGGGVLALLCVFVIAEVPLRGRESMAATAADTITGAEIPVKRGVAAEGAAQ
ncbi:MAG: MDR family MFS transporter [Chloroflexota bacterium]